MNDEEDPFADLKLSSAIRCINRGHMKRYPGEEKIDAQMIKDLKADGADIEMADELDPDGTLGADTNTIANDLAAKPIADEEEDDQYQPKPVEMEDENSWDFEIKADDIVILEANMDNGEFALKVHLYDEKEEHLVNHHDIMLSQPPMSLEYIPKYSTDGNSCECNYGVVGLADGGLEMWDLDVLDPVAPQHVLKKVHEESVTSIHLNPNIVEVMATAGADQRVVIWDVNQAKDAHIYKMDSVVTQIQFHPQHKNILNVLSEDAVLHIVDCREEKVVKKVELLSHMGEKQSQPLCICNSEFDPDVCYIGVDLGIVAKFNCKTLRVENFLDISKLSTRKSRSNEIVFIESYNCKKINKRGVVVGSQNGSVYVLDEHLELIKSQDLKVGKLVCGNVNRDTDYILIAGGTDANIAVFDFEQYLNK